jgi:hypothetical protein
MRFPWLALIVALAPGCGTMRFTRSGPFSEQMLQKDWTECEAMNPYAGVAPRSDYQERCMVGRGWTRVDESDETAAQERRRNWNECNAASTSSDEAARQKQIEGRMHKRGYGVKR